MIKKIYLDEVEKTEEEGKELLIKYVQDYMTLEGFLAGIPVKTPEGMLRAEVVI